MYHADAQEYLRLLWLFGCVFMCIGIVGTSVIHTHLLVLLGGGYTVGN